MCKGGRVIAVGRLSESKGWWWNRLEYGIFSLFVDILLTAIYAIYLSRMNGPPARGKSSWWLSSWSIIGGIRDQSSCEFGLLILRWRVRETIDSYDRTLHKGMIEWITGGGWVTLRGWEENCKFWRNFGYFLLINLFCCRGIERKIIKIVILSCY